MKEIDDLVAEQARKNCDGTLTVGEAIIGNYYRLLEGENAGRVVIKTCASNDGKPIIFFANELTWVYVSKLKDVRCEIVRPQFSKGEQPINRSQATWYNDNSSEPQHYSW
jgi:hypothetical protein